MVLQLLTSALEASCPILKSHCPLSYCHVASWFVPGPRMARRNTTGSSRHLEGAGAESSMMQTVQLAIADGMYAARFVKPCPVVAHGMWNRSAGPTLRS